MKPSVGIGIGVGVLLVGAAGVYLYEKKNAPLGTAPLWHEIKGSGTLLKNTTVAIAAPNPSPDVVKAFAYIASTSLLSGVQVLQAGTSPPTGWPTDDPFGATAIRLTGKVVNTMPFDLSTVPSARMWIHT